MLTPNSDAYVVLLFFEGSYHIGTYHFLIAWTLSVVVSSGSVILIGVCSADLWKRLSLAPH